MIGALLMITVFKYSIVIGSSFHLGFLWSQMSEDEYVFVKHPVVAVKKS